MARRAMTPVQFRKIREQLGLNQTELADKLDITQSAVSSFESGTQPINARTAMAVKYLVLVEVVPEEVDVQQAV